MKKVILLLAVLQVFIACFIGCNGNDSEKTSVELQTFGIELPENNVFKTHIEADSLQLHSFPIKCTKDKKFECVFTSEDQAFEKSSGIVSDSSENCTVKAGNNLYIYAGFPQVEEIPFTFGKVIIKSVKTDAEDASETLYDGYVILELTYFSARSEKITEEMKQAIQKSYPDSSEYELYYYGKAIEVKNFENGITQTELDELIK